MTLPARTVGDPGCQQNWDAYSKAADREIRGVVTATYNGSQTWAISTAVAHGLNGTPHVLCSLSEYFELGALIATVQPYAVSSSSFSLIVTVSAANPPAGTVVHLNYLAWV